MRIKSVGQFMDAPVASDVRMVAAAVQRKTQIAVSDRNAVFAVIEQGGAEAGFAQVSVISVAHLKFRFIPACVCRSRTLYGAVLYFAAGAVSFQVQIKRGFQQSVRAVPIDKSMCCAVVSQQVRRKQESCR